MAEPGTEITLYERYEDTLFVPLTVNNEAITGVVGESGLYLRSQKYRGRYHWIWYHGSIHLQGA